jgi:hypothetical protein
MACRGGDLAFSAFALAFSRRGRALRFHGGRRPARRTSSRSACPPNRGPRSLAPAQRQDRVGPGNPHGEHAHDVFLPLVPLAPGVFTGR